MWSFDFPWWFVALVYLLAFMAYFGVGAVLGFVVTYATLADSAREDGWVHKGRLARAMLSLIGALASGALNFVVVYSVA